MAFTDAQLAAALQAYLWVFTRTGAAMMVAPVLGSGRTPMRIRLVLALLVSLLLTPLLPAFTPPPVWSADWFLQIAWQVLIGVACGLLLRLCFEAVMLAGVMVANVMGLGFAQMADPVNGGGAPAVGPFLVTLATLLFLVQDGHLHFISWLAAGLQALPPGGAGPGLALNAEVLAAGSRMFEGALRIALPAVLALLLANLAVGVMSRAAPSLNLTSVGLPVSLLIGLLLLQLTVSVMPGVFEDLLLQTQQALQRITHD